MGAFGSFAIGSAVGQASTPTEKRPGFGSMRGESRFKGMMAKEGVEETGRSVKEKSSLGSLGRLNETERDKGVSSWMEGRSQQQTSDDSDYPNDELRAGSAALGGGFDHSPAQQRGFGASAVHDQRDEGIFSALGMTTDTVGLRGGVNDDFSHQTPQHRNEGLHEPMSPTDTNPFQSPDNDRNGSDDHDTDGSDIPNTHLPGLGGFGSNQPGLHSLGGFGLGRGSAPYENTASDRSQTSSVGPGRGLTTLSGLGGLPGLGGASAWSAAPGAGTPTRERSAFGGAFGEGLFGSVADMQSPVVGLAGLGGSNAFSTAPGSAIGGMGTIGRGSRMGSLFPAAMQEEMRSDDPGRLGNEESPFDPFQRQQSGFGAGFGRAPFGGNPMGGSIPAQDTDSPFRSGRGILDDLIGNAPREQDITSPFGEPINSPFGMSNPLGTAQQQNLSTFPSQEAIGGQRGSQPVLQRQASGIVSPGGGQPPVSQIRTMVMPDRMKWIYKDPQNELQGPWSGLEMHDWYKAGFFTPELLIKKLEDPEFEPLAQLIRRIGNSREPFLVPQIGVPHEPSVNPSRALQPPATGASSAQPPFASSFPSFGTTLTAEQQNALERRKQEEQYLMARQKEHLAQQQLLIKQMQIQGGGHGILPGQLHHHSSAHSLHSQPSFGSITSPGGYQPSPTQGPISGGQPVPGFYEAPFRAAPGSGLGPIGGDPKILSNIREDEIPGMLERLNLGRGTQHSIGGGQAPFSQNQPMDPHPQQVAAMLNDRARVQREQAEHDLLQQRMNQGDIDAQMASDRLHQFHDLRLQTDMEQENMSRNEYESSEQDKSAGMDAQLLNRIQKEMQAESEHAREQGPSLTQQVQAAASAKQASAQQMSWTKVDITTMEPMQRPPQSVSPMPAPVAQRKQNVADNLVAESRSRTQSPAVETPNATLAPWAKETVEAPKGPSLKEIQEAEAKKAAKQEEIVAAQRRAALEKEYALAQVAAHAAPAPGLPSTSNWASAQSPAGSTSSAPSVWAKPSNKNTGSKTLQQIQKEEEDRKRRVAAAATTAVSGVGISTQPLSSGKRYADITSKTSASPGPLGNSPWTTVGAGGKVKALPIATPTGPPGAVRSISGGVPLSQTPKPVASRSTTMGSTQMGKLGKADAMDEFKKWAIAELVRGQLNMEVKRKNLQFT
jgi:PERQ amino acid-rich with GYF domain-containing protein